VSRLPKTVCSEGCIATHTLWNSRIGQIRLLVLLELQAGFFEAF